MLLKSLYTEPGDIFDKIIFKNGINFIFGKKDSGDSKASLNGIGKSLLIDLIDFCLLSSFTKSHSPRLYKAKEILSGHYIVLEFIIDSKTYIIKRSIETPKARIFFGTDYIFEEYTEKTIKKVLCQKIFKQNNYIGQFSNNWLRKLVPFYVKVERPKKEKYIDPISYIKDLRPTELNVYHLFLMSINNILAYGNWKLQIELKKSEDLLKGVTEYIKDNYGFQDINDADVRIDRISNEISKISKTLKSFKLAEEYEDVEKSANKLTSEIKNLWFQNYSDRKKLKAFDQSFSLKPDVSPIRIRNIYNQYNQLLSEKIHLTLKEAMGFRKKLVESRKDFLKDEIETLKNKMSERDKKIINLEKKRAQLFSFLANKEAIKDLSEAYLAMSQKRQELVELESKTKIYTDLRKEKADKKNEESKIISQMLSFLEENKKKISEFRAIFSEVYDAIYTDTQEESVFKFCVKEKQKAKLLIDINFPSEDSKGKNQGKTLVYDLSVLFHSIEKDLNTPRFLIHDGIFDGMDRAHFVSLYEYLEEKQMNYEFQYIITLNEEGTLNSKFGHSEKVSPEKIEEEAIIVLTPNKKLLRKDF